MLIRGISYYASESNTIYVLSMEGFGMSENVLPASVYHYTSLSSVVQILQGRKLWASDARYLNDAQEIQFGISLAKEVLSARSFHGRDEWLNILDKNDGTLDAAFSMDVEPYVVSFTSNGDNLEMWRGYGGEGCAIEFDVSVLRELCSLQKEGRASEWRLTKKEYDCLVGNNSPLSSDFRRVVYGVEAGKELLDGMFEDIGESPELHQIGALFSLSAFVKHEAFQSEDEIRLLVRGYTYMTSRVMVREARGHLIPYRTLIFPYAAVKSIIVGPGRYMHRTKVALQRSLYTARGEWGGVEVKLSAIPYLT